MGRLADAIIGIATISQLPTVLFSGEGLRLVGLSHRVSVVNIKELFKDIISSDNFVLTVESLTLSIILLEQYLLFNVLRFFDILHVQSAEIFLNEEGWYETDERKAYPKKEAIQVIDMFWCIISDTFHELDVTER